MTDQFAENKTVSSTANTAISADSTQPKWFVLRDLKRPNAKYPNYQVLRDKGFEVYMPTMKARAHTAKRRKVLVEVPIMQSMIFVHSSEEALNPIIKDIDTLQYRFVPGGYMRPMMVRDYDMQRFIRATSSESYIESLSPDDIKPHMLGKRVRVNGGPLDGMEVTLLKIRGARKKRAIVEIPNLIVAVVQIDLAEDSV
ncbi:MAG: UpxY family transcription antiterminator [Bacteroidales bacterium]|nr:UpxY family transcription antiterminator [Bacteroidales bacterium]